MPLTQLSLTATLAWQLNRPQAGFADIVQGGDSASLGLAGLSLSQWDELFGAQYTIAPAGTQTVNLNSFTDPAGTAVTGLHALALMVLVTGAATDALNVKPAAANALQWFFGSMTDAGINVHGGGAFLWTDPPGATGAALTAGACELLLTNTGAGALTVKVLALVGTT